MHISPCSKRDKGGKFAEDFLGVPPNMLDYEKRWALRCDWPYPMDKISL